MAAALGPPPARFRGAPDAKGGEQSGSGGVEMSGADH